MDADRLREVRQRAHELHLLASDLLALEPLSPAPVPPPGPALSDRQHAILRLLAQGCSNKAIAYRLHLSEKTVRNLVAEAYRRLGVHDRVLAAQVYRQMCEAST